MARYTCIGSVNCCVIKRFGGVFVMLFSDISFGIRGKRATCV